VAGIDEAPGGGGEAFVGGEFRTAEGDAELVEEDVIAAGDEEPFVGGLVELVDGEGALRVSRADGISTSRTSALTSTVATDLFLFSILSLSGTVSPFLSACLRPISMICIPPGFTSTSPLGGTSIKSIGRMVITSPAISLMCSSTASATSLSTRNNRSGVVRLL